MESKKGFRVGDRVFYNREPGSEFFEHFKDYEEGTVCRLNGWGTERIGVEFDEPHDQFHSCGGRGRDGHCLYIQCNELRHVAADLPDFIASEREDVNIFLGVT